MNVSLVPVSLFAWTRICMCAGGARTCWRPSSLMLSAGGAGYATAAPCRCGVSGAHDMLRAGRKRKTQAAADARPWHVAFACRPAQRIGTLLTGYHKEPDARVTVSAVVTLCPCVLLSSWLKKWRPRSGPRGSRAWRVGRAW